MTMNFGFDGGRVGPLRQRQRPDADEPFRVLVIGDFSGRGSRGVTEPLAGRRAHKVDLDALDTLPKAMGTQVIAAGVPIDVLGIDRFHPDELYRRHDLFAALKTLRARLLAPATFADAAREVQSWAGAAASEARAVVEAKPEPGPASDFDALLRGITGAARPAVSATIDQMVRAAVGPHIVPAADPRQDALVATVDRAIAAQMNRVLHDPAWQSVEAAWRGLQLLVQRLELDDDTLTLHALDATREELRRGGAALQGLLVTGPVQTAGGQPWSLIVSLERFGPSEADAELLRTLGGLALAAGAPFIAGAEDALLGVPSVADAPGFQAWGPVPAAYAELAKAPEAAAVALVLPRVLLRLPYGARTEPVEAFDFDELAGLSKGEVVPHAAYLWGCGSLVAALVLAESFSMVGWRLHAGAAGEIDDLPVHAVTGSEMKPCGEAWLTHAAAEALTQRNLSAVVSVQRRGAVQFMGLRSLAGGVPAARWG